MELVRQNIRCEWRSYYNNKSSHSWDLYIEQRHLFCKEVRKAKRESWKLFTEDTDDPKSASCLFKCAQTQLKASIGILSDTPSNDPVDSVQQLLDVHFPGSRPTVDKGGRETKVENLGTYREAYRATRFITMPRIKWAIEHFSSNKAAGPDGIQPVVLKNLPDSYLQQLQILYISSISIGYVPQKWRHSKVVFILKPGKEDHAKAKSFCLITHTSFIFRTLERVVLDHLEDEGIYEKLHINQHTFCKGLSCDLALSDMVDEIESSLLRQSIGAKCPICSILKKSQWLGLCHE